MTAATVDGLVVDTNVLLVAEFGEHGGAACRLACAKLLDSIRQDGVLVLDDDGEALEEYGRKLKSSTRQPGVGMMFFRWAIANKFGSPMIALVKMAPLPSGLRPFDDDDHKWLRIYLSSPATAVVNASDSDYVEHEELLSAHGIVVRNPCVAA